MDSVNKNMTEMIQQSAMGIAKQTNKQKKPNISSPTRALEKRREMIENNTVSASARDKSTKYFTHI